MGSKKGLSVFFGVMLYLMIIPLRSETWCKKQVKFDHFSVEDGLTQNEIYSSFQDSKGFLWFGTGNGLCRYDGYEFRNYKHDPDNLNTISNGFIRSIVEDSEGNLWLAISGGGLNKFDPYHEEFVSYRSNPDDPYSVSGNIVNALLVDEQQNLWIGSNLGLDRKIPQTQEFVHYIADSDDESSLTDNHITVLYEDKTGIIWIGTRNGGLNQLSKRERYRENARFTSFQNDPDNPATIASNKIRAIFEDRLGTLWIGTQNGLNRFDRSSQTFTRYNCIPDDEGTLSNDNITSISEDDKGTLWIGTYGGGLNSLVRNKDVSHPYIQRYRYDLRDPHSLSNEFIQSLYYDQSGVLWIGTSGSGIDKMIPDGKGFIHYKLISDIAMPKTDKNCIWALHEDPQGDLWIASSEGGVYQLNAEKEFKNFYSLTLPGEDESSPVIVKSILQDRNMKLWFGTEEKGLIRFNPETNKFTHYKANFRREYSLSGNEITDICEDKNGDIWIGTIMRGLNRYEPETGRFYQYFIPSADSNPMGSNFIYSLFIDRHGNLWIGTHIGGLHCLPAEEKFSESPTFISFRRVPGDSTSLSSDIVTSIYEDRSGILWIGTHGGGLNKYIAERKQFVRYTIQDGLPDNIIYGILEDQEGCLWISTNNGLSHFDTATESFINYDQNEGLQGNEFNKGSAFKSQTGEMFFGGLNGFNAFYPENITTAQFPPKVVVTDFQIFNTSVPIGNDKSSRIILNRSITVTDSLYLTYQDRVISFKCAALHYLCPEQNQYAYIMEGYDKDWNYSGNRRFITYTNLPPGGYNLKINAANSDNVWTDDPRTIWIKISPPFWKTLWFKILIALSLLSIAYSLYRLRIHSLNRKRHLLEEQMAEKSRSAKALENALSQVEKLKNRLQAENIYLQDEIKLEHNFANIITRSEALKKILRQVEQVASTNSTVLITGESGTGKELIARAIHNISTRKDHTLVKVDCSALPPTLIESELFGHEKGSFTGATSKKIGRFEIANGGTIFLDEIGELSPKLQTKLLRILQDGEFERIGSTQTIKIDVRVLAATNRHLEKEIEAGKFREDLYYRLNVFPIQLPPLRDRKEDIPLLIKHCVRNYSQKLGKHIQNIPQSVIDELSNYDWPGNVRELENVIQRAIIISKDSTLRLGNSFKSNQVRMDQSSMESLDNIQRTHIIKALEITKGRISGAQGAANLLKINPKTLYSRMKKLNISPPKV